MGSREAACYANQRNAKQRNHASSFTLISVTPKSVNAELVGNRSDGVNGTYWLSIQPLTQPPIPGERRVNLNTLAKTVTLINLTGARAAISKAQVFVSIC